jgi:hypothetical protein
VGLVTRSSVIRRTVEGMYDYRPHEALAHVSCAVTVLVAAAAVDDEDRRERLLAIDDAQRARAEAGLVPMRVRRIEDAGHDLMRHRPAEVADEIALLARGPDALSPGVPATGPSVAGVP